MIWEDMDCYIEDKAKRIQLEDMIMIVSIAVSNTNILDTHHKKLIVNITYLLYRY